MIIWKTVRPDGGVLIGIGLEAGNITKLKEGKPILRSLDVVGYVGAAVAIIYGETKEDIIADIKRHGIEVQEMPPTPEPGATGAFPDGQIGPDDEGEIALRLSREGDLVRIEFGKDLSWLAFSPNEAKELAAKLMAMAERAQNN